MSAQPAVYTETAAQSCLTAIENASDAAAALRRLAGRDRAAFVQVASTLLQSWPASSELRCLISVLSSNELPDALLSAAVQAVAQAAHLVRTVGVLRSHVRTCLTDWLARETAETSTQRLPDVLRAMELLAGIDRLETPPALLDLANHGNEQIRSKAVRLADRENVQQSWRLQRLTDTNARVRANAVESMWGARDPASLQTFEAMLSDDHPRVAGNAVMGLYRADAEADARAALKNLGAHPDARFRRAAAWVAGEIGGSETLLERLRGDSDPAVRVSALKSLVRMRRAVPPQDQEQPPAA
jgi:hypothetical protein